MSNFRESIKLSDDSKLSVMRRGNLKLCIGGMIQVITDVYYISGLRNNLLSIGQLQQKNLTTLFSKDSCKFYHENKGLIMSSQVSSNRMYVIYAAVVIPMCLKGACTSDTKLWHYRYAHLSLKGLDTLAKKDMFKGLPILQETEEMCADCVIGKQHRDSIPKMQIEEPLKSCSLFIKIYVDLLILRQMVEACIS